jgi:hypothetical protein
MIDICQRCQQEETSACIKVKPNVALWLCGRCWMAVHGKTDKMFGEHGDGMLFTTQNPHGEQG